jgi:hypothetical protein
MTANRPTSTPTLGAVLERDRLEHRLGRLGLAVAALRRRARAHRRGRDEPPRHIRQAIADFEAEILAMKAQLRGAARDQPLTPDSGKERGR